MFYQSSHSGLWIGARPFLLYLKLLFRTTDVIARLVLFQTWDIVIARLKGCPPPFITSGKLFTKPVQVFRLLEDFLPFSILLQIYFVQQYFNMGLSLLEHFYQGGCHHFKSTQEFRLLDLHQFTFLHRDKWEILQEPFWGYFTEDLPLAHSHDHFSLQGYFALFSPSQNSFEQFALARPYHVQVAVLIGTGIVHIGSGQVHMGFCEARCFEPSLRLLDDDLIRLLLNEFEDLTSLHRQIYFLQAVFMP